MVKIFDDVFDRGFTTFKKFLTGLKHFDKVKKSSMHCLLPYSCEQKHMLLFRKLSFGGVSNQDMSLNEVCFYSETSKFGK